MLRKLNVASSTTTTSSSVRELRQYQLMAVRAVAAAEGLRERLVLRGSAALWLRYLPSRTAVDLDFVDLEWLRPGGCRDMSRLEADVRRVLDTHFRSVLGEDRARLSAAQRLVRFDISPAYMPLSPVRHTLPGGRTEVLVCDLDYMIAEKLAAAANQMSRRHFRPAQALDLHGLLARHAGGVDPAKVRLYLNLVRESEGGCAVTHDFFSGPLRAWSDREAVRGSAPAEWQAAWRAVEEFVAALPVE